MLSRRACAAAGEPASYSIARRLRQRQRPPCAPRDVRGAASPRQSASAQCRNRRVRGLPRGCRISRQHFQVPFRIVWTVGQTVEDRERPVGGDARRVDRECFFQRRLDVSGALPGPIKIGEASRGSTFLGAVATACLNAASASSSLPRAYSTPPSCVWALLRSGSVFTASLKIDSAESKSFNAAEACLRRMCVDVFGVALQDPFRPRARLRIYRG